MAWREEMSRKAREAEVLLGQQASEPLKTQLSTRYSCFGDESTRMALFVCYFKLSHAKESTRISTSW
jgi:hypothetical protein